MENDGKDQFIDALKRTLKAVKVMQDGVEQAKKVAERIEKKM